MMGEKVQLGVLFGGRSGEHEVSLMSARSVLSVLDTQKYEYYSDRHHPPAFGLPGHTHKVLALVEALQSGNTRRYDPRDTPARSQDRTLVLNRRMGVWKL